MSKPSELTKSNPATGAAPRAGAMSSVSCVNVLLVDDHEENLLALEAVLEGLGHHLVRARSGQEALKCLLNEDFAVILLDVLMPGMDGFETAALIRDRERSKHTPIIFMTAVSTSENHVFKGYSVGAVDYIFKPFSAEVLRAKVSVFVDLFRKTQQVAEQGERLRRIESRQHRRELARIREQRNRFFYLSLDMMCVLGYDGFLQEVNTVWENALGLTSSEFLNAPLIEFIHPDDRTRTVEYWKTARISPSTSFSVENRVRRKDGSYRWLLWSSVAVAREKVYYAVAHDITARKQSEEALQSINDTLERSVRQRTEELSVANEELKRQIAERTRMADMLELERKNLIRSNQELEQFAYAASHDLREPLRKVTSFAQLLKLHAKGKIDPEADQYLEIIVGDAARMDQLISDLLEYSQVSREQEPNQIVDLGAVVKQALDNLSVVMRDKKATVTYDAMPLLKANPTQLISLFQNLIGNAVKFTGEDLPTVHIGARQIGTDWQFSVRDNGIGIEPCYHDRIFEIFKRLHNRTKYPGTGIGLAICKKIVERHRGRIWLESEPGKGSTFHFTIPA